MKKYANDARGTSIPTFSPSAVARLRLTDRLDTMTGIALVTGVAGSGRTTLVGSWVRGLEASGAHVHWVTASAALANPPGLWNRLLDTTDGSPGRFADVLAASGSPSVVVLDDADSYLTPAHVTDFVDLIRRAPGCRLVIIGHVLPEFPASVAATRVRCWELHTSSDELAAIAESMGLKLPRRAVDAVHDSFQGWLTPSLIALRAMVDGFAEGRAAEHAYGLAMEKATAFVAKTFDYAETIDVLKPLWLWLCADELTAETARVAIGIDHPHRLIARLEDEGAILSVPDASPTTWRANLGPVLAGMLAKEFEERFADEARAAQGRLSSWHLANGDQAGAVSHAIAAEDWDSASELLTVHWSSLLSFSSETLRASINALPQHFLDSNPRWIEARNFVNYLTSGTDARPVKFRHTARQTTGDLMDLLSTLTSRSGAFRSSGQFEEAAEVAEEAQNALRVVPAAEVGAVDFVLPEFRAQWGISFALAADGRRAVAALEASYDEALERGNTRIAVDAAGNLALIIASSGLSAHASSWLTRMPRYKEDESPPHPAHTAGNLARAFIALDRLDIDEARAMAARVDNLRSPEQWALRESLLAQLSAVSGDARARLATLHTVLEVKESNSWSSGINRWVVLVTLADLMIASGQAPAALDLLDQAQQPTAGPMCEYVDTARARAALFSGQSERAVEIALVHIAAASTGVRALAELLLVLAAVELAASRLEVAATRVRGALNLIETHTLPLLLTRVPRAAFEMLVALPGCAVDDETLRRVRAANELTVVVNPVSSLSRRERDVLRSLVAGASIDDIARQQFVTRNTVKTQVRSIYKKLGTCSREATVRAACTLRGL